MTCELNKTVNTAELVDIQSVKIDTALPVPEKIVSYQNQIRNHKLFLFDDITVRVSFMDGGPSLKERLKQYLLSGQSAELTSA